MAAHKTRRRRLTYAEPNEREIRDAWKAALTVHSICLDDLEQAVQMQSFELDPYKTAFNEGYRAMAGRLIGFTVDQPETKVNKNVED